MTLRTSTLLLRVSKLTVSVFSASLLTLSLSACGGGGSSDTGGGGTSSGGDGADETEGFDMEGFEDGDPQVDHGSQSARELLGVQGPETPWESMDHAAQVDYMIAYVLPIAAEDFRGYSASRYEQMDCATCHGDDADERGYEMPSTSLPPLAAPGSPGWTRMSERNPAAVEFMSTVVTPTVRTQLGFAEYDPATGQGFGCFGCHPHAE